MWLSSGRQACVCPDEHGRHHRQVQRRSVARHRADSPRIGTAKQHRQERLQQLHLAHADGTAERKAAIPGEESEVHREQRRRSRSRPKQPWSGPDASGQFAQRDRQGERQRSAPAPTQITCCGAHRGADSRAPAHVAGRRARGHSEQQQPVSAGERGRRRSETAAKASTSSEARSARRPRSRLDGCWRICTAAAMAAVASGSSTGHHRRMHRRPPPRNGPGRVNSGQPNTTPSGRGRRRRRPLLIEARQPCAHDP